VKLKGTAVTDTGCTGTVSGSLEGLMILDSGSGTVTYCTGLGLLDIALGDAFLMSLVILAWAPVVGWVVAHWVKNLV